MTFFYLRKGLFLFGQGRCSARVRGNRRKAVCSMTCSMEVGCLKICHPKSHVSCVSSHGNFAILRRTQTYHMLGEWYSMICIQWTEGAKEQRSILSQPRNRSASGCVVHVGVHGQAILVLVGLHPWCSLLCGWHYWLGCGHHNRFAAWWQLGRLRDPYAHLASPRKVDTSSPPKSERNCLLRIFLERVSLCLSLSLSLFLSLPPSIPCLPASRGIFITCRHVIFIYIYTHILDRYIYIYSLHTHTHPWS